MPAEDKLVEDRVREAELLASEAIGSLIEFWGFKRQMGRIWTLLYLSEDPLPAAEICRELKLSAGAASMTLAELEQWGVVRRIRKAGERRDYFGAETDLWKMITRVWREREMRQIEGAIDTFDRALGLLDAAARSRGAQAAVRFKSQRLRHLSSLAKLGAALAKTILEQGKLDLSPLRAWRGKSEEHA